MKLSTKLGIEYDVIQGAMAHITLGEFAGRVSKHGGLGIIASGGQSEESLAQEIKLAQTLTDNPIGVNIMIQNPNIINMLHVIINHNIPIITYTGGSIAPYIDLLHHHNIICIGVCKNVNEAIQADNDSADMIIAQGYESGGHIGMTSTLVLVPQIIDAVSIPVIAAGGIYDNRGLKAMKALGAIGVQVGTAFITTHESLLPHSYKQILIDSQINPTTITGLKYNQPVRVIKNSLSTKYNELEYSDSSFEMLETLTKGSLKRAVVDGDVEMGSIMAGQVCVHINKISTIQEVLKKIGN